MVCNIRGGGGQLGTKVVISALGMLALYMRFNGTGIWGGETIYITYSSDIHSGIHVIIQVSARCFCVVIWLLSTVQQKVCRLFDQMTYVRIRQRMASSCTRQIFINII